MLQIFITFIALVVFVLNTIVCGVSILLLSPFKLIFFRIPTCQMFIHRISVTIAEIWVDINSLNLTLTQKVKWQIEGLENLDKDKWHFIIANHQTSIDIVILQHIFRRKIPFPKFVIKKELFWVPILGPCWWMLDFPFVTRRKQSNNQSPSKDFKTLESTCDKLQQTPSSIISFLEGTRFTNKKSKKSNSPYKHLLRPKSGSFSLILNHMEQKIDQIIDVTIVYPDGAQNLFALFNNRVKSIIIKVNIIDVSKDLTGDYSCDPNYRKYIQDFLAKVWKTKINLSSPHIKSTLRQSYFSSFFTPRLP